ncbi:alpha/beta fold hydrolase [Shinella granuli]|uniref:Pimeloyl-ACP methyl ester carboxylesterase n=1 Tax=Shinella granuli TaxID=323621 RepID=A0A4R2C9K5_SHIGR|nr:alpha/beta hydrolase [Shinella granuli]TCN35414.1 pimeloyl-ACP methyl ester carboxylesterase [Shinella granuli]
MVKDRYPIMSLSAAASAGFVAGHFPVSPCDVGGEETGTYQTPPSFIHYVGTPDWENQASGCVLLHGGSGDWRHFCINLKPLSAHIPIVAPDLPGFGLSGAASGEDLAAIVDPLAAFLRSVPWRDITLVGFSFGALAAAAAAVKRPPSRLLLISPAGFGAHTAEMASAREAAAQAAKLEGTRAGLAVNLKRTMLRRDYSLGSEHLLDTMEEMLRSTRAKVRRFSRSELILDRLRMLDCPVRVLFGEADPYHASALDHRYAGIAAACSGAEITTVADAAHWLMFDRPDAFEETLLEFARRDV